jgi:hypothetical protein
MAAGARRAALAIVVVVVGVACGRPVDATSGPRTTSEETTTTRHGNAATVPLVLETGAPRRPPAVGLVVHSDRREITRPGVLYTAGWLGRDGALSRGPSFPVPWPVRSTIDRGDEAAIALGTQIVPDFVVVKAYEQVEVGSGAPSAAPVATFECGRFSEPRCAVSRNGSGLRIGAPGRNLLTGGYLIVFCAWHVPASLRSTDANAPDDLSASWLFRVNERSPDSAQP